MLRWYAMCKVKCADERYGDLSVHILKCESAPFSGMFQSEGCTLWQYVRAQSIV